MPKRYVKLTGHKDRHTNSVDGITLANGKLIRVDEPADISATEREHLEEMGYQFETSSKKELEEIAEDSAPQPVGSDVAGASPDLVAGDFEYDQEEGGE